MVIGIISDTHDNVPNIKKAMELFKKRNVEFVIHAGDIVAPGTVKYFDGIKMMFIFGNCDGDRNNIVSKINSLGNAEHFGNSIELKHKGKKICVFHGHNKIIQKKMLEQGFDYYIHGHTHIPEDKIEGNTRVLCPGGQYLGGSKEEHKIIFLDVEKDEVEFVDIK